MRPWAEEGGRAGTEGGGHEKDVLERGGTKSTPFTA
jgi:hypothetical protein